MRPVFQTIFGDKTGNCFQACIASVLEMELEQVPNFCAEYPRDWWERFQSWLAKRGMFAIEVRFDNGSMAPVSPGVYCILTGKSPRHDCNHAIVGKSGDTNWFEFVHDPAPGGGGFKDNKAEWVLFFAPIDPRVLIGGRRYRAESETTLV